MAPASNATTTSTKAPEASTGVPPSTDLILMERLAVGDESVLADLYERYGSLVYSLALRVVRDHQLAEECTQDVFVTLWRRADRYDAQRGRLTTWLLTITRNRAIELIRRRDARPADPRAEVEVTGTALDPALSALDAEDTLIMADAMALLPPPQYEVLRLAYYGGLSQSEVAAQLDVPLGTVKGRTRLALKRLEAIVDREQLAS